MDDGQTFHYTSREELPTIREFIRLGQQCRVFHSAVVWLVRKAGCPVDQAEEATFSTAVTELLQLCVFCLGFEQDRNVGLSVLPECEEILTRSTALGSVALQRIGTCELEMSQRRDGSLSTIPAMVEDFLKFCCRFAAPMCC